MEPRNVIVLTPPGAIEPSLAIAASRAGAIGVIDLEFVEDYFTSLSSIDRLSQFSSNRFGIQIRPDRIRLESLLSASIKPNIVILTGVDGALSVDWIGKLRASS